MSSEIQKIIDDALAKIKEPWEKEGVLFREAKVKGLPKEMKYTIEALNLTQQLVQPDFSVINKKIEPRKLSLILKAASFDGVKVKMEFYPERWTNGYGFDLGLYFELEQGKFKSVANGALKHQYPVSLSADAIHVYSQLRGWIIDLKKDLLVVSRLRKNYNSGENLPSGPSTS
jgi:hypothetical protein